MHHINPHKTGMAVGAFLGLFHLVWAVLVALGWAQGIYDFILWAHMIKLPLVVQSFDMAAAVTLVILTAVMGYVFGYVYAVLFNRMHR